MSQTKAFEGTGSAVRRIADMLQLFQDCLTVHRRIVHAGDSIYQVGQDFDSLHVIHSGCFKMVNLSGDGREVGCRTLARLGTRVARKVVEFAQPEQCRVVRIVPVLRLEIPLAELAELRGRIAHDDDPHRPKA